MQHILMHHLPKFAGAAQKSQTAPVLDRIAEHLAEVKSAANWWRKGDSPDIFRYFSVESAAEYDKAYALCSALNKHLYALENRQGYKGNYRLEESESMLDDRICFEFRAETGTGETLDQVPEIGICVELKSEQANHLYRLKRTIEQTIAVAVAAEVGDSGPYLFIPKHHIEIKWDMGGFFSLSFHSKPIAGRWAKKDILAFVGAIPTNE